MFTGHGSVDRFVQREEYTQRTKNGYAGTTYGSNVPGGTTHLRKVASPRR